MSGQVEHTLVTTPRVFAADEDWSVYDGKKVLVTGGTGSFGRAFIQEMLQRANPSRVAVFSRDELKQYEMEQQFRPLDENGVMRYFIGDVRDLPRLEMAFRGVDYVVHAAALKHVPIAEYNPFECIHTNVLGAENVVQAAIKADVKKVIALSTDKAASPINLYGASKLASDKIFIAANYLSPREGTRFSVIRYGNVIGSRGSVVPFFESLIKSGSNHLPITDERMTRFWITLSQGVDFVTSCLNMAQGGETYIPKIPSLKIMDLAHAMAPDLEKRTVGIRPGEKLHEIMITEDDGRLTFEFEDRYVIEPNGQFHGSENRMAREKGVQVAERFSYSSDKNIEWCDPDVFLKLSRETKDPSK